MIYQYQMVILPEIEENNRTLRRQILSRIWEQIEGKIGRCLTSGAQMFSIRKKTHEDELLAFKAYIGEREYNLRLDYVRDTKIDQFLLGESN